LRDKKNQHLLFLGGGGGGGGGERGGEEFFQTMTLENTIFSTLQSPIVDTIHLLEH